MTTKKFNFEPTQLAPLSSALGFTMHVYRPSTEAEDVNAFIQALPTHFPSSHFKLNDMIMIVPEKFPGIVMLLVTDVSGENAEIITIE